MLLVFFLISPGLVVAGNNYFWLVRIMPNLRTIVQGLARVFAPEGAAIASANMHYYSLNSDSLPSGTGTGPNPQVQSGWNMNNLMSLNWQALPQRIITPSGEKGDSSYSSFVKNIQSCLPDLSQASHIFPPVRVGVGFSGASLGLPVPFWGLPLNLGMATGQTGSQLDSGIEIIPQGTSSQLIAPMTPVQSAITAQIQGSQLALAINAAVRDQGLSQSSFSPMISGLLASLADEGSYSGNNMFFAPSLNSYFMLSSATNSALSLVPHETLIRLGLIPDADSEDHSHLNPDTWGEKK